MRISDLSLLAKKIAVGVIITLVPLGIVAGSLWVTQHSVAPKASLSSHSTEASHGN